MRKLATLAAVAIMTWSGATAFADAKLYSGGPCNPGWDGPLSTTSMTIHTSILYVIATSNGPEASCPITRDSTLDTDGAADIEINLVGSGTPDNATCMAGATTISGSSLIVASRTRNTTGKMDWSNSINTSIAHTSATPGSSYFLYCDLPADWRITNYFVDE
jgi:hypothetical protein